VGVRHEVRRLIGGISLLRAWLLRSSEIPKRRLEVLSHSHGRHVVHVVVEVWVHVWLNGYHRTSVNEVGVLSGKLKIPCHGRSIDADVLVS
jgi:hypothetical protein